MAETYSVGKQPWAWADTQEEAEKIRRDDGKTRLGVYRWHLTILEDGRHLVSLPVKVA